MSTAERRKTPKEGCWQYFLSFQKNVSRCTVLFNLYSPVVGHKKSQAALIELAWLRVLKVSFTARFQGGLSVYAPNCNLSHRIWLKNDLRLFYEPL